MSRPDSRYASVDVSYTPSPTSSTKVSVDTKFCAPSTACTSRRGPHVPTAVALDQVRFEYPWICSRDGRLFVKFDANPVMCIDAPESRYAFCFAEELLSEKILAKGKSAGS